ncbi:DUF2235 domain-containing protein [Thalassotalea agarivorans]|uniref:Uncharacterized alpha/beta hydrolase domain n=1 Tax=Thalassotalea agarivorans TaxID=349064 RepID=A0A1I0E7E2_THASX|nr:DUF2235 domain-containing protein [Thalassotalea agarivorans]SET40909.1 Uncharacterized alpha/beta hydrolase domain [Thalassotalea agarivorans]
MAKRIVICCDGTWNRPERLNKNDHPTNVLKFARAISPEDSHGNKQVVFYDWGIGSYHNKLLGGAIGAGLDKNIKDAYRFLVHNYSEGDEIFLFGFSRGAYTVRSLCGMLNNCGILKSVHGNKIEQAFELYKTKKYKPSSDYAKQWRSQYAIAVDSKVDFVGVFDTVGAMGLPFTIFGLIDDKDLFYDRKLGGNIKVARHALSLDELRSDFEPTVWLPREGVDLQQVWFTGSHSDIGGGYAPDKDDSVLSDIPMRWMQSQANAHGLQFDPYLTNVSSNTFASIHNEYKGKFKLMGKLVREIPAQHKIPTSIHASVFERMQQSDYNNESVQKYKQRYGDLPPIAEDEPSQ